MDILRFEAVTEDIGIFPPRYWLDDAMVGCDHCCGEPVAMVIADDGETEATVCAEHLKPYLGAR